MLKTLAILPPPFWVVIGLLGLGAVLASGRIRQGVGLPMLAVLATVAFWYVGDALYNEYAENYTHKFAPQTLKNAWWQVALFVVVFVATAPVVNRILNARYLHLRSRVSQMLNAGIADALFQMRLERLLNACVLIWVLLTIVAVIRLRSEVVYYFFPFLGHLADPWGRGRVGGGIDAVLSLAGYLQMFVAGSFGVVAALATEPRVRRLALLGCLLTWPYYIFNRARNVMLAALVPAVLAWTFLRLRGGIMIRVVVLTACFLLINAWFGFVIANRSSLSIAAAVKQEGFNVEAAEEVHHEGLNMFEELCWINTFMEQGTYTPNRGRRYFAELVNPIPRSLWPGKPMIGIDYAIARGQAGGSEEQAGVYATISTGMIGQGVVNFGRVFGPAFAALLMSVWVAVLTRCDLRGERIGRIPLYALGLILTFNLGRDITFITLYTFIFGAVVVWAVERYAAKDAPSQVQAAEARRGNRRKHSSRRSRSSRTVKVREIGSRP